MSPLDAVAWTVIAGAAMVAVYWAIVLGRLATLLPKLPRVRSGLAVEAPAGGWPSVSIIVPAHNEERVVEACAATLLASDYPSLQVVMVLDRCTDRTRELLRPFEARDARLKVIENRDCPPDWAGKCNAARVGVEHATGEYLLFTDADVEFDPQLVRASMGMASRDGRDLLSLLPTLTTETWFERVVQPVAAMTLLRMYPIEKVNHERYRRPFANGQFMLFSRAMYERIGGHASVKDDLLEDIAFARGVEAAGGRGGIAIADGMLVVNMYATLAAMRTGWKRIFIEACKRKIARLRQNAFRVVSLGVLAPLLQVAAIVAGMVLGGAAVVVAIAIVCGGMLLQCFALVVIFAVSRSPISGAFFFPLGSLIVAKALWDGASDLASGRPVRWGGRDYVLTPRD